MLELIDGQQRMTTLFLTLCGIRDRIGSLGEEPPGGLKPQIAAVTTDPSGLDHFRYRLDLQYEDSGNILVHIAKGTLDAADESKTRSITNIRNAYNMVLEFLAREFGNNTTQLRISTATWSTR